MLAGNGKEDTFFGLEGAQRKKREKTVVFTIYQHSNSVVYIIKNNNQSIYYISIMYLVLF